MKTTAMLAGLVCLVGCGKVPATSQPDAAKPKEEPRAVAKAVEQKDVVVKPKTAPQTMKNDPPEVTPVTPPPVEKKDPPKKEPEVRIKLADARVKILNLNKAGVKGLMGVPTETRQTTINGVNALVWVYRGQKVVWDADAEKHYPIVTVAFYELADGSDPGNAIEVNAR